MWKIKITRVPEQDLEQSANRSTAKFLSKYRNFERDGRSIWKGFTNAVKDHRDAQAMMRINRRIEEDRLRRLLDR